MPLPARNRHVQIAPAIKFCTVLAPLVNGVSDEDSATSRSMGEYYVFLEDKFGICIEH